MNRVSVRTGAVFALPWIGLLVALQARSGDLPQTVVELAPDRPVILPAMRAGGFSRGGTILISGAGTTLISRAGTETASSASIPWRLATESQVPRDICVAP